MRVELSAARSNSCVALLFPSQFTLQNLHSLKVARGRGWGGALCCGERPWALETETALNLSSAAH